MHVYINLKKNDIGIRVIFGRQPHVQPLGKGRFETFENKTSKFRSILVILCQLIKLCLLYVKMKIDQTISHGKGAWG